jgi:hypothetical protein
MNSDGDYTAAGFDKFLTRADQTIGGNLDAVAPNNAVAFDRTQVTGQLGDTLRIGNIHIDGISGRISIYEGENEVVRIGELGDG